MLKVGDMTIEEMHELLLRAQYGHLGCSRDGHTYVVPMHYAFDGRDIYFFTTEGTKTEFIAANHEVCFQRGFEQTNAMKFGEARKLITHPVACIDCHDSQTMALRVTRPGFMEGMRALKASQGIQNYDVNKQATRQEMRSFVCGQCHVEYYFKGPEKRLVYPWAKGLNIDNIMSRRGGAQGLGARGDGRARPQSAAPGIRDVQSGRSRAFRRGLRRLSHALPARGRDEDQRPSRSLAAPEHQPRLPDLLQVAGR